MHGWFSLFDHVSAFSCLEKSQWFFRKEDPGSLSPRIDCKVFSPYFGSWKSETLAERTEVWAGMAKAWIEDLIIRSLEPDI